MDTVTWRELSKLLRLALMGIGAAIAAVVVSVLLGFGASSASAADDEAPGLLGAVTGLVDDTTSVVGSTVTGVTSVAAEVVTTVVSVAPAPVQQPVTAVVETVGSTVGAVVAPVQDVVATEVVTTVTEPVVDVVTAVPVVGDVVSALGLDKTINAIAADVDDTLATVVGAVSDTGVVLAPPAPAVPDADGVLTPQRATSTLVAAVPAETPASALEARHTVPVVPSASVAPVDVAKALATAGLSAVDSGGILNSMGALCLSVVSSGPGGAGLGVWALAALLPFVAHRAWVRRAGPENDLVPSAPAGSTDVSPD